MAGYTSSALRLLAREAGCGMVFSEVIAVKALLYNSPKTGELLRFREAERPIGIQLLSADPDLIARAVPLVEEAGPDGLDINLGCPVPKITSKQEGGALLEDPQRAVTVVGAAARAASVPVSVKLRLPHDADLARFTELCLRFVDTGVAAITLHPRRVADGFRGHSRWEVFGELAARLPVPLIASGDVRRTDHVRGLLAAGCAGVMIGRAAVGNPGIFGVIAAELAGSPPPSTGPAERLKVCLRHLELLREEKGDRRGVLELRKQLSRYLRGVPHSRTLTERLVRVDDADLLQAELEEILGQLGAA
jgi:nifR3 family TIM-barrel protein